MDLLPVTDTGRAAVKAAILVPVRRENGLSFCALSYKNYYSSVKYLPNV